MDEATFVKIVEEEWDRVPEEHRAHIQNVALLVEDVPSEEVRTQEGLVGNGTLLGLYQGIPLIERGEGYGTGPVLPDTITIYRLPTLREAEAMQAGGASAALPDLVRQVVRDTIWHEVGHYFGWDEESVMHREDEGTNIFGI
jgi:predicted Zn-dependent protease with MMP-like domain